MGAGTRYTAEQKADYSARIKALVDGGMKMKAACAEVGIHPSVLYFWNKGKKKKAAPEVDEGGLSALQEKLTEMPVRSCVQDIGNKMVRVFVFEGPCVDVVDTLNRVFWA